MTLGELYAEVEDLLRRGWERDTLVLVCGVGVPIRAASDTIVGSAELSGETLVLFLDGVDAQA